MSPTVTPVVGSVGMAILFEAESFSVACIDHTFTCGWTPGLSPHFGDYESRCYERGRVPARLGARAIMEESLSMKQGRL